MTIDEIVKKATIKFPKNLTLDQSKELLIYIAKNLPGNINYNFSQHISMGYPIGSGLFHEHKGTSEITGMITSKNEKEAMPFDSFKFEHSQEDTSILSSIQFQITPDWELSDYRPDVVRLWDEVRKITEKYFSAKGVLEAQHR